MPNDPCQADLETLESGMKTPIDSSHDWPPFVTLLADPTHYHLISPQAFNSPTSTQTSITTETDEPKIKPPLPMKTSEATRRRDKELLDYLTPASNFPRRERLDERLKTDHHPILDLIPPIIHSSSSTSGFGPLRASSDWIGSQRSGHRSYSVSVKILHLDLLAGHGSGLLEITGLTEKWPKSVTFFDIEILGPHHGFLTKAWGATPKSDREHWSQFPSFQDALSLDRLQNQFNLSHHHHHHQVDRESYMFMRWKEKFWDGNSLGREVEGASFAGFYYVCMDLNGSSSSSTSSTSTSSSTSTNDQGTMIKNPNLNPINPTYLRRWPSTQSSYPSQRTSQRISTQPMPSDHSHHHDWSRARIKAYYYHSKSEPFQELNLRPTSKHNGSSGTYQFC